MDYIGQSNMNLDEIRNKFLESLKTINDHKALQNLKVEFLGKKGVVTDLLKTISSLDLEKKKTLGSEINVLKNTINTFISEKENEFRERDIQAKLKSETLDITLPPRQELNGTIHPIPYVMKELRDIFVSMGFAITDGPEIESDWYCFEALNIPKHHPARQMQDTFYLPNFNDEKIVLRTQTTSLQVREMEKSTPPFKFVTMGKTFRSEMDATHCPMFHQIDGVFIDKNVNIQDLKDCLMTFLKKFFNLDKINLRFRPSYFPFTTPSLEIDIKCRKTKEKLFLGEGDDWLEILGGGMIHTNVLKNVNIDPEEYQGFAFGAGVDRLAMLKYGIRDMRGLFDGDMRFLRAYGFNFFN